MSRSAAPPLDLRPSVPLSFRIRVKGSESRTRIRSTSGDLPSLRGPGNALNGASGPRIPSQQSESRTNDSDPSIGRRDSVRFGLCLAASAGPSESHIRVEYPSRTSESNLQGASPSHISETHIRAEYPSLISDSFIVAERGVHVGLQVRRGIAGGVEHRLHLRERERGRERERESTAPTRW